MKKNIILGAAIVCILVAMLVGCGSKSSGVAVPERNYQDVQPNIVKIGDTNWDEGFYYIVDKNTGVVYLGFDKYQKGGITVMLNADGTPVTAEQLGIEY